ncbi:MAG: HTTM domain-containing protein [Myxococcales bacterium]|nr:HTTM domain-containing protein [Myxococcales bacterium]
MKRLLAHLKRVYLEADPRSMGLFRVFLGILLCYDVARRWPNVEEFYSNAGWLPNHFALFRPMSAHLFSVYHAFSSPGEVKALLAIHFCVALALLVGWHTRVMHLLVLVLTTSLNSRNIALENGGWVMVNLITLWSVFLPLGRRFSIDAVRKKLQRRDPGRDLEPPPSAGESAGFDRAPYYSLAFLAVLLQWAIVYYFNAVHKSGPSWSDGNAIYYFIHQDRLTHSLGIWVRDWLPLSASRGMTHLALVIEYAIAPLLLLPVFHRPARVLAWGIAWGLHLGIATFASLGPFVWVMMVPYPLFVASEYWDELEAWARRRKPAVVLRIRAVPGGYSVARLCLALDTLALCQVELDGEVEPPFQARRAAGDDEWLSGGTAVALLGRSWFIPRPLTAWLGLPGVSSVVGWCVRRLVVGGQLERDVPRLPASEQRLRVERGLFWVAQAMVVVLMLATGSQVLVENRGVPASMKLPQPEWAKAIVVYPRLFQGWSMFAPDPPHEDGRVIVDGRTADGRKLDPLTGMEPSWSVPRDPRVWNDGDWAAFHTRIPEPRFSANYPALRQMLLRHHEFTGHPEDRLISFEVWYGTQGIPPPGQPTPRPRFRRLLSFGRVRDPGVPREFVGN